jgi:hypothetical protein
MTPLWLLTSVLMGAGATPAQLQPMLEKALLGALVAPDGKVEARGIKLRLPPGCVVVEARADVPVRSSARVPFSLSGMARDGSPCRGLAWADARVTLQVPVTSNVVAPGSLVESQVSLQWREVRGQEQPWLQPMGELTFAQALPRGVVVQEQHVQRNIPKAGTGVEVMFKSARISLSARGRMVNCGARRACAQLPSGKQVEGNFVNGTLWVEAP